LRRPPCLSPRCSETSLFDRERHWPSRPARLCIGRSRSRPPLTFGWGPQSSTEEPHH
jgi:hypothetical protein